MFFRVTEDFQVQQEKRCALKLHKIDKDKADIYIYIHVFFIRELWVIVYLFAC